MADLEKIIKLVFEGDGTGLNREMKIVSRDFDNFSRDVQAATAPLGDFGIKVAKAEAALIALGVAGLAYSVKQFQNFEDVMLKVKGVIGASADEYEQLTAMTKNLGATTRYTATEAAQGLEFLALAGFSVEESLTALPNVLNLAQASALDLGRAADIVTNIMAGYGIEVEDLTQTNDVLTATFTNSNTSLDQLGQAFKMVGPVAKSLGLEIDETAAILGTLGNAGYQAEMGGTALRNILLALVAPAGNFSKLTKELGVDTQELGIDLASSANALKSLGVNVKGANGELLPFTDIMDQMKVGLEKIQDPADRTAILIEVFGKRGGPQMAALLGQGAEAVDGLQTKIQELGGVTDKIAADMESGIGGAFRAFRSAFEAGAIEVGEAISNDFGGAISGMTEIFRTVAAEVDRGTFDPIFDALNSFFQDTESLLQDIAQNLPEALAGVDFSGLVESFKGLGSEIEDALDALFGGDLDLSTVDGLEKAIQRVVDLFAGMTNFTAGFIEGLKPLFIALGEVAEKFAEMDEEGHTLAGNITGWAQSINTLFGVLDQFKGVLFAIAGIAGFNQVATFFSTLRAISAGGSIGVLGTSVANLGTSVRSLVGAFVGLVGAGALGWEFGRWIGQLNGGMIDNAVQDFAKWTDEIFNWTGTQGDANETAKETVEQIKNIGNGIAEIPEYLKVTTQTDTQSLDELLSTPFIEDGLDAEIRMTQNMAALEKAQEDAESVTGEKEVEIIGYFNGEAVYGDIEKATQEQEVEVKLTVQEQAKMDLERDLANIEASAENLQTAMEWTAKVDIAEIEAAAELGVAAFDNVGDSVVAVTDAVASMYSAFTENAGDLRLSDKWFAMDTLEAELEMQSKLIDSQVELNAAQAEYMRLKNERIESGEASEIMIDTTGVEPALEMVMWHIIEKVQIRANENAQEFLLGMPS